MNKLNIILDTTAEIETGLNKNPDIIYTYGIFNKINVNEIKKINIKNDMIYIYSHPKSNFIAGKIRFKEQIMEKLIELQFLEFKDTYKKILNLDFLKNCKMLNQIEINKNGLQNIDVFKDLPNLELVSFKTNLNLDFIHTLNLCQKLRYIYMNKKDSYLIELYEKEIGVWNKYIIYNKD